MPQHRRHVFTIENDESFDKAIQELSNGFLIVKFFASWCNHCEIMKPIFYKLAAKYRHIKFMDVNVETCQNSAECYKITCLPSFIFFENGEKTTSFCGADPSAFEQKVLEIAECNNVFKRSKKIKSKTIELCHGLNLSPESQINHVLQPGKNSFIESQSGPQLLLNVVFCEYLNLGSISFSGPEDRGPKLVSIYYNIKTNPDFRSILTYEPDEVLYLTTNELVLKLKKHLTNTKSDSVCKITIYIQSNQEEGDITRVDQIAFFRFKSDRKRS